MRTIWTILSVGASLVSALCAQVGERVSLAENGPSENRIDIVFLSEGYRLEELELFVRHARYFSDYLFTIEPFAAYRSAFNCHALPVASNESGSDHPSAGVFRDTYFNSSYDSWGLSRGLTIPPNDFISDPSQGFEKARALLADAFPEWDIIVLIVNDSTFGGWGDFRGVVTSINFNAGELFVHEMGHTLGGLGDEYSTPFPLDPYPVVEEPNTTRETRPDFIKWKAWIEESTPIPTPPATGYDERIGLFEGARYEERGWYRPKFDCLMRSLYQPFCEVCREALVRAIYRKIRPLDSRRPSGERVSVSGAVSVGFDVRPVSGLSPQLEYGWRLDGILLDEGGPAVEIHTGELGNGAHRLVLDVRDPTSWVRTDREHLLSQEVEWTVEVSALRAADSRRSFFPRLAEAGGLFNGIALTNLTPDPVHIELASYDDRGGSSSGRRAELSLDAGHQVARLASEFFGEASQQSGWIFAESDHPGIRALFLSGDGELELDGSSAPGIASRRVYFPAIDALNGKPLSSELLVVNPNDHEILIRIRTWNAGEIQSERRAAVPPRGIFSTAVETEDSSGTAFYEVTVEQGFGAVGWQLLRSDSGPTRITLNGLTEASGTGYSAQFAAQEGQLFTRVDLINPQDQADSVRVEVFGEEGERRAGPRDFEIGAHASLQLDARELLRQEGGELRIGSLVVQSGNGALLGTVVFGDAGPGLDFAAGLPLQQEAVREAVFSQMADNAKIFTGLALFNPGTGEARVRILACTASGEKVGETTLLLPPRGRVSRLVRELIEEARGQVGGYLRISSDRPLVVQQLFGDTRLRYLASVPPG